MSKIYTSFEQLIGNTPLLEAQNFKKSLSQDIRLLVKLECFNPAGSVKDRVAYAMIVDAEEKGLLQKGGTIIEPTSGNTGIGLAAVATARGYQTILVMPDTMSVERRTLLRAYGAKVVLSPGKEGMAGAIRVANEIAEKTPNSFIPKQFDNPANPQAHYQTTGPEIYNDTDGQIDYFVAGVGTGGTLTGIGRYLKENNPHIKLIAVEPSSSPLLSKGVAGPHGIQGIGANFIPSILDTTLYDEVLPITDEEALTNARHFAKMEGILVGISSGAALAAASQIAQREEALHKTIVVLCPDGGDRYLSTSLYEENE